MEAICPSETSVLTRATWYKVPKDICQEFIVSATFHGLADSLITMMNANEDIGFLDFVHRPAFRKMNLFAPSDEERETHSVVTVNRGQPQSLHNLRQFPRRSVL
jgi:hypothetical protein